MTTGTRVLDGRSYGYNSNGGWGWTGVYFSKTWNGTDWPKGVYTPPTYIQKPVFTLERVPTGSGRFSLVKKVSGYVSVRASTGARKGPKRSTVSEEHPYSCSISIDKLWTYAYGVPGFYFRSTANTADGALDFPYYTPTFSSNNDIELINKLRSQMVGDFDPGIFLAELPQSLSMIRNAAFRVDRAWRAYRKGDIRKAGSYLVDKRPGSGSHKTSANNWLELQYGWLPLLNDAYNAGESLAKITQPFVHVVRVSRKVNSGGFSGYSSGNSYDFDSRSSFARKSIKAIYRETGVPTLTMLNPLSVAWEKLPYSFVVDWFIPIGNYLSARGFASSVSGTFVTTLVTRSEGKGLRPAPGTGNFQVVGGDMYKLRLNLTRTVSSSLSVPPPSFKALDKIATWRHTTNAVALLLQR